MYRELLRLPAAAVLGLCIGLLYDALRPLRQRAGRLPAVLLDILFCALSCAAVFCYAMTAENGTLGLWELTAALAGLLLYSYSLSGFFCAIFTVVTDRAAATVGIAVKTAKKILLLLKNLFKKMRECFIIRK